MLANLPNEVFKVILLNVLQIPDQTHTNPQTVSIISANKSLHHTKQAILFTILQQKGIKNLKHTTNLLCSLCFFTWIDKVTLATLQFNHGLGVLDPEGLCRDFQQNTDSVFSLRLLQYRQEQSIAPYAKASRWIQTKIGVIVQFCEHFYFKIYFHNDIADDAYLSLWNDFISGNLMKITDFCNFLKQEQIWN